MGVLLAERGVVLARMKACTLCGDFPLGTAAPIMVARSKVAVSKVAMAIVASDFRTPCRLGSADELVLGALVPRALRIRLENWVWAFAAKSLRCSTVANPLAESGEPADVLQGLTQAVDAKDVWNTREPRRAVEWKRRRCGARRLPW